MSTARRRLGTGPGTPTTTAAGTEPGPRLLPIERAAIEDQEHADIEARTDRGPVPSGRRRLGVPPGNTSEDR